MWDMTYTLDIVDCSFEEVRQIVATETGTNIVLDSSVSSAARLTLKLKDARPEVIYKEIARQLAQPWSPMAGGAMFGKAASGPPSTIPAKPPR